MSVRLKSGRSPVRSRPWPPGLVQFNSHFCAGVEPRTATNPDSFWRPGAWPENPKIRAANEILGKTPIPERLPQASQSSAELRARAEAIRRLTI
jgi:hypothetical protein